MKKVATVIMTLCFVLSFANGSAGYDRKVVRDAQARLLQLGFSPGPADGLFGPRTKKAILKFQERKDIEASGALDDATLVALGIQEVSERPPWITDEPSEGDAYRLAVISEVGGVTDESTLAKKVSVTERFIQEFRGIVNGQ